MALALEVEFTLPSFLRKKMCLRKQMIEINKYRKSNFVKKFLFQSNITLEHISKALDKEAVRKMVIQLWLPFSCCFLYSRVALKTRKDGCILCPSKGTFRQFPCLLGVLKVEMRDANVIGNSETGHWNISKFMHRVKFAMPALLVAQKQVTGT